MDVEKVLRVLLKIMQVLCSACIVVCLIEMILYKKDED
jgi:hypothetical protein